MPSSGIADFSLQSVPGGLTGGIVGGDSSRATTVNATYSATSCPRGFIVRVASDVTVDTLDGTTRFIYYAAAAGVPHPIRFTKIYGATDLTNTTLISVFW